MALGSLSDSSIGTDPVRDANIARMNETLDKAKQDFRNFAIGFSVFMAIGVGLAVHMVLDDRKQARKRGSRW